MKRGSLLRGTEGSNPSLSSGESSANLIIGAGLLSLGGDNAALGERADELVAITTEQGFPALHAQGTVYRGYAKVKNSDVVKGISLLRSVLSAYRHSPEACCLGLVGLGEQTGLGVVYFRDITVNVCEACRNDDRRRSELVNRLPRYLRPLAREWVSLPGSTRFAQFERKERCYFIATMVKDTALSPAAG